MDTCPNPDCQAPLERQYHRDRCAACFADIGAPNVRAANHPEEAAALERRYQTAVQSAAARGVGAVLHAFEAALAESKAVVNTTLGDAETLFRYADGILTTYAKMVEAEKMRTPAAPEHHATRQTVEAKLFPRYEGTIRYAVLSLDRKGLLSYGPCSLVLGDAFIQRRASVLAENSYAFADRHALRLVNNTKVPGGYQADWSGRAKLAVTKLVDRLGTASTAADFPSILLKTAGDRRTDDFLEVHIYGTVATYAVEEVILPSATRGRGAKYTRARLRLIKGALNRMGKSWKQIR